MKTGHILKEDDEFSLDVVNLGFPGGTVRYLCLEIRRLSPARDTDFEVHPHIGSGGTGVGKSPVK